MNESGPGVTWIDRAMLDALSDTARGLARRRKNLNFHPGDDFVAHRLLNAIEPESYITPHRHLDAAKDETILALRGRLGIVIFAADGSVRETAILSPDGPCFGIDIAHGTFHTLLALESGSVMFEAKAGPFRPLSAEEVAPWAPAEGHADAGPYLAGLRRMFSGDDRSA